MAGWSLGGLEKTGRRRREGGMEEQEREERRGGRKKKRGVEKLTKGAAQEFAILGQLTSSVFQEVPSILAAVNGQH